jgi:class 3 adenylate cyclase/pimeloyl-ACP methyl ester carboxylesterase
MEPRIQYAKTSDGVNIAFWSIGEGTPLIHLAPNAFGHIQMEWQIADNRVWYEQLARGRNLIRMDSRGQGLSDPDVSDYSGLSWLRDVRAVVQRLGLKRYALLGLQHSGLIAMAYAAKYPEEVSHLILWCTWARGQDTVSKELRGLRPLMEQNWELYAEAIAHGLLGWSEGERAHEFATVVRKSITKDRLRIFMRATLEGDVTPILGRIQAPTLVLHRRGVPMPDETVARKLAVSIPNASLILMEGTSVVPWLGDTGAVVHAIDEFTGVVPRTEVEPQLAGERQGTAVILFADIADSTALTERLGDAAFRAKARDLDTTLRTVIRENAGTPIEGKLLGDGVLAVFTSARQAIEAALACGKAGDEGGLPLHLGLHAGDVIREENNVYGGAVNVASRIADASAPGEVLVSQTVRDLARTSAGVSFEDRGQRALKGVGEAVRVWAVWQAEA